MKTVFIVEEYYGGGAWTTEKVFMLDSDAEEYVCEEEEKFPGINLRIKEWAVVQ